MRVSKYNRRFQESGGPLLSSKEGSLSSLIIKHNADIKALERTRDKQGLIDIVTVMMEETNSPAVISKIEDEVLPKLESMSFTAGLDYLYRGILLKGDQLSMGRLSPGYKGRY